MVVAVVILHKIIIKKLTKFAVNIFHRSSARLIFPSCTRGC